MINISDTLSFYKRKDVQEAILSYCKDREVCAMYGLNQFGKRPDILNYPADIIELVKQNATSFHISEESWISPLQLSPEMRREQLNELRRGWDLVLDIDCNWLEYSKLAAYLLIQKLKSIGITSVSCKFSGNHGFHIGVPFEAFPEKMKGNLTKDLFPEAPRVIAAYLKDKIKEPLGKEIQKLENNDFPKILEKVGKNEKEIVESKRNEYGFAERHLNAESFLEIDTILIASRHLYRAPYSFNEKSGLISVPIDPDKVLEFNKEYAKPNNVKINEFIFLDNKNVMSDESKRLFVEAYDFEARNARKAEIEEDVKSEGKVKRVFNDNFEKAAPRDFFPPCIKKILAGIKDGKKRSLFILTNFLTTLGWNYEEIENLMQEWNKRNEEQLREVLIRGQLRYHKQRKKKILPPNCRKAYEDFQVCVPDAICQKIKNPVNYTKRRMFFARKEAEPKGTGRARLTEEQKEMRRAYRERLKKEKVVK